PHTELFKYVPGADVKDIGDRDDPLEPVISEAVVDPRTRSFRRKSPPPEPPYQTIAHLDLARLAKRLKPRRADHLTRLFPNDRAHPKPVRIIARNIELQPFAKPLRVLSFRPAQILVHLRIRPLFNKFVEVVERVPAKCEPRRFEHPLWFRCHIAGPRGVTHI